MSEIYAGRPDPFRGKSLEQKVQELADREEIRDLITVYAQRVAHGVGQADLFTDDAVFITRLPGRPPTETRGRAELEKRLGAHPGSGPTLPMIHNILIEIDGDEARAMCANEVRTREGGVSIIGSGYYRDTLKRVDGCWLFARREIDFFHFVPLQDGWAKPAEK